MVIGAYDMAEFRRDAESDMTCEFEAFAPTGTARDADGMKYPTFQSKGTSKGKVQGQSLMGKDPITRTVTVAGVAVPVINGGIHLPIDAWVTDAGLQLASGDRGIGWELVCTRAMSVADDPAVVGRRYLVVSAPTKSRATSRRLDVVEVPNPEVAP